MDGWMDDTGGSVYRCVESGQADTGRREERKVHTVVSFMRHVTPSYHVTSQCV